MRSIRKYATCPLYPRRLSTAPQEMNRLGPRYVSNEYEVVLRLKRQGQVVGLGHGLKRRSLSFQRKTSHAKPGRALGARVRVPAFQERFRLVLTFAVHTRRNSPGPTKVKTVIAACLDCPNHAADFARSPYRDSVNTTRTSLPRYPYPTQSTWRPLG